MPGSPRAKTNPAGWRGAAPWPAAALAAALLTSCATPRAVAPLPPYVVPAGAPTARLLSRGAVTPGDRYGVFVLDDAEKCAGPRLAATGNATQAPKATQIVAGRTATVDFVVLRPDKTACRVRWSFTPIAGKTYVVAGALVGSGCNARVLDATDPDRVRAEATAQRRNLGTNACSPLAAAAATAPLGGTEQTGEAVLRPGAGTDDLQGLIQP
ncbi:MAG: hypothetical protein ACXWUL_00770 [Caldimonas sp.]